MWHPASEAWQASKRAHADKSWLADSSFFLHLRARVFCVCMCVQVVDMTGQAPEVLREGMGDVSMFQ